MGNGEWGMGNGPSGVSRGQVEATALSAQKLEAKELLSLD
jgi:hypothetical protein